MTLRDAPSFLWKRRRTTPRAATPKPNQIKKTEACLRNWAACPRSVRCDAAAQFPNDTKPFGGLTRNSQLAVSGRDMALRLGATSQNVREPQTVLIVDDSETIRKTVVTTLEIARAGDRFLVAASATEALKLMAEHDVSLVLCDIEMPEVDGFSFLRLKRSNPDLADVPVIMVTVRDNVNAKVRGLSEGASDYLTKPFDAQELAARVRIHLQIKALQDELKRRNARLEELSRTDALTGLANRRHFMELLESEVERCKRYSSCASLILLDVDHFKTINDTFGHPIGDRVLSRVGLILSTLLRKCDSAARYGGEEFVLLLPETPTAGACVVAERCRTAIETNAFEYLDSRVRVTASLGVATFPCGNLSNAEDFFKYADGLLYEAKRLGRNRVVQAR
jgi:diguanylate cyclase (GGDEF)-like protein